MAIGFSDNVDIRGVTYAGYVGVLTGVRLVQSKYWDLIAEPLILQT